MVHVSFIESQIPDAPRLGEMSQAKATIITMIEVKADLQSSVGALDQAGIMHTPFARRWCNALGEPR